MKDQSVSESTSSLLASKPRAAPSGDLGVAVEARTAVTPRQVQHETEESDMQLRAIPKCGHVALVLDCCYVDICVIFSSFGSGSSQTLSSGLDTLRSKASRFRRT